MRERTNLCTCCHSGQIRTIVHKDKPSYKSKGSWWFPSSHASDGLCEYCYQITQRDDGWENPDRRFRGNLGYSPL